jgi:long-chain acyl-CoA synthetase
MEVKRTFDLLERYALLHQKDNALSYKQKDAWVSWSTQEYIKTCYDVACGLLHLGLKKGDRVITATNNRPEWNFIDHALSMCGIIHVPVYTSLSEQEYRFIVQHCEARMIFASDKKLAERFRDAVNSSKTDETIYTFDPVEGFSHWEKVKKLGETNRDRWIQEIESTKESIDEKDVTTLLYTSGTTGTPKGVMLTHENLVKNFLAAAEIFQLASDDKYLSILPLCHVGGRLGNYQSQYSGSSIYYPENMGAFARAMKEINADGFDAVPRVLEKVYDNIVGKGNQLTGMKKRLFFWAIKLGFRYEPFGQNGWFYERKLKIADKLIFSKWRDALGGKVRLVGCGGASLQPRLERLFWAAGVRVLNMYGLTETSPIITINGQVKGTVKLGTVGKCIEGVEVRIADDGEILCRGHNVMSGYFKDPELTRSVFDEEGWFHTGDIGNLDRNGFLSVTDRKKEIFKLSNGKFIAPQVLENLFKQSAMIDQIMVTGEHEKFATAIVVPDYAYIKGWCDDNNVTFGSNDELICMPDVELHYRQEINRINKNLSEHERINKFRLVPEVWSPESGELSPTLKLKRKVVHERYQLLIDSMYEK